MTESNSPKCPICDRDTEVVWVSRIEQDGSVVAQRWVCTDCNAMFGLDFQFALLERAADGFGVVHA